MDEAEDTIIHVIQGELNAFNDKSCPHTLLSHMKQILFRDHMNRAMNARLKRLSEIQNIREDEALGLLKTEILTFLNKTLSKNLSSEQLIHTIQNDLKSCSTIPVIQKVLSYPIVKDVISTSVKDKCTEGDSCGTCLISVIVSIRSCYFRSVIIDFLKYF